MVERKQLLNLLLGNWFPFSLVLEVESDRSYHLVHLDVRVELFVVVDSVY